MDRSSADALLVDADLVPALEGSVAAARELERRLLASDIPAMLAKPDGDCCTTGSCGTKLQVLVREEDMPRLTQLLQAEWLEALAREGTLTDGVKTAATPTCGLTQLTTPAQAGAEDVLTCPACGFAGALVNGACGDCGLQLE